MPVASGAYLETYERTEPLDERKTAFFIRGCGITTRSVRQRFREHTSCYLSGRYNVLDMDYVSLAQRKLVHQGSWWTKNLRAGPRLEGAALREAVDRQLGMLRLFVADMREEKRIMERVEAAVMNHLYCSGQPYCDFFDEGTYRVVRRTDEQLIKVTMTSDYPLLGLPPILHA